jgi:type IX secretion system PorP/SprF family membrane protein
VRKLFLISVLIFSAFMLKAQDPQFSQYYAAPIYMNPAFAGNAVQGRAVLNYRNQWPAMPGKFVSYAASFDYNIDDLNSGLALGVQHDKAGSASLRYTNVSLSYSYTVRISRTLAFKPGMYFSYTFRDVNQNDLIFGDQLIYDNPISGSVNQFTPEPVRYPDLGFGGLAYQRNWWAGISFKHVNRPNQSLVDQEVRLPMHFSMHGGYNYVIKQNVKKKQISSVTFVLNYKAQAKWDQLDFGAYYKYKVITTGLYYRGLPLKNNRYEQANADAIIAMVGFEYKDFGMAYSYDLTLSKLVANSGGAHEISLVWEFADERKKRKRRRSKFLIPCAKF